MSATSVGAGAKVRPPPDAAPPAGPASGGLAIAGSARAILGPRGRAVKLNQPAAVIAGHSHRPGLARRDGVLVLNPGSIGPRRFTLPVAMGFLTIRGARVRGRLVCLDP